jgi:hypothetical protein
MGTIGSIDKGVPCLDASSYNNIKTEREKELTYSMEPK